MHVAVGFVATAASAQCPIETLVSPSPTADRFGNGLAMNDRHLIVIDSRDTGSDGVFVYRREPSGSWVFDAALDAPGNLADVSLFGDRAIVTVFFAGVCSGPAAYVYELRDSAWVRTETICGLMSQPYGVVLNEDLFAIQSGSSSVVVFRNIDGEWTFVERLANPDSPSTSSAFGVGMAMSERSVFIGAYRERVPAGPGGAVYVYERTLSGPLALKQKLVAPDVHNAPAFGTSISIAGDLLVIGGYLSPRSYEDQGAVYVYRLIDDQWQLEQELTHSNPGENDQFGVAVATDGQRIVASARYADTRFRSAGRVYVFERDGTGSWIQTQAFDHQDPTYGYGTVLGLGAGVVAAGPGGGFVDLVDLNQDCCRPDLDDDGVLTIFDYLAFQTLFDAQDARADFDDDGVLTIFDFLVFQSDFVDGCD